MLVVQGRDELVLNLSGDKVRPELVEQALVSFAGIEQAAAFTKTNDLGIAELWGAIVTRVPVDVLALRKHCEHVLGRAFAPIHYLKVDTLPRNDRGKVERHRLAALAEKGPDNSSP